MLEHRSKHLTKLTCGEGGGGRGREGERSGRERKRMERGERECERVKERERVSEMIKLKTFACSIYS